jgi:hypothetical protein
LTEITSRPEDETVAPKKKRYIALVRASNQQQVEVSLAAQV